QGDVLEHVLVAMNPARAALNRCQRFSIVEAEIAELDFAEDLTGSADRWNTGIGDLRLLGQDALNAPHRCSTSLEKADDPSQGNDWPSELHHVGVESHKAAHGDAIQQHFAPANPQHDDDRETEERFQRRPQHAHQANQLEAACDVFGVLTLEAVDFSLLLHIGANQARPGKVLLRFRRDFGEHCLDSFEALVNLASKVLHHNADNGQGNECKNCQAGADTHHERQRTSGEHHSVGGVHDARAYQHADRVEVIGGARHNVAGAGALVKTVGEPLEMSEQVIAQIEFDFARDADQDPASKVLEDSLGSSDRKQPRRIGQQLV